MLARIFDYQLVGGLVLCRRRKVSTVSVWPSRSTRAPKQRSTSDMMLISEMRVGTLRDGAFPPWPSNAAADQLERPEFFAPDTATSPAQP